MVDSEVRYLPRFESIAAGTVDVSQLRFWLWVSPVFHFDHRKHNAQCEVDVELRGTRATTYKDILRKRDHVIVTGILRSRKYRHAQTGSWRRHVYIEATVLQILPYLGDGFGKDKVVVPREVLDRMRLAHRVAFETDPEKLRLLDPDDDP